jgi:hypothetical protein
VSDLHALPFLSIPPDILAALDNRDYRFAVQPFHHLIRMAHILAASVFFGAILLLDLRLTSTRSTLPLRALSGLVMPWVFGTFAVAMLTGLMLFFYDPVHVGSHAYFTLKMIFLILGIVNAQLFNRGGFAAALSAPGPMPTQARIVGALSLILWLGAMICATLNAEAAPKVLLR